jgi:hypothetical protein
MSQDNGELDKQLERFFREVLVPLAETARKNGVEFFPLGPGATGSSYYSECGEKRTYLHGVELSNLENEVEQLWETGDFPELASIAGKIAEFSELLKENEDEKDEISPFIYAMF